MRSLRWTISSADDDGGERVQFAGGLVVKDQLRFDDQGAGDGDALFHAAGEFAGHFVLGAFEADDFEFFGDDAGDFLRGLEAVLGQVKADVFADGQGIEQGAGLEDHGHAVLVHDLGRLDGLAVDEDFAGVGCLPGR